MTLVLASKFKDGIAFAYDRLVYAGCGIPDKFEDKTYILGNLAVGMSGTIINPDESVSGIAHQFGTLLSESDPQSLMYSLAHTRTNSRLLSVWERKNRFRECYLFGFVKGTEPKLFYYDDSQTRRPIEKDWEGIGFGMYPEVRSHMEKYFDKNRTLDDAVNVLNDGVKIAFEINKRSNDGYRLAGQGFTVVTSKGARKHQRQISEAELRLAFNTSKATNSGRNKNLFLPEI